MDWILILTILVLGLSIGSFLNVVIFRLGKKRGIFLGRSECANCGHLLKWPDLIPILSFVILKGRCRYCKRQISWVYPSVEIITAVAFLSFIYLGAVFNHRTIYGLILISGLIVIVFSDLLEMWIPDKIIIPLAILALIANMTQPDLSLKIATALVIGSLFAIISLASKGRSMGLGDAKLVFFMGLALGYPLGVAAVLISIWVAALVGIGMVIAKRGTMKTALPLGTFLGSVSIVAIIFRNELQQIIQIYL